MTKPDEVASFSQFSVVAENTLVGPVGPFLNTIILTVSTPNQLFLASKTYDKQLTIEKNWAISSGLVTRRLYF